MAQLGLTGITPALDLVLMERSRDQFRRDVVLLNLLGFKQDRNSACVWNPKFLVSTAAANAAGADLGSGEYDTNKRVQASLPWANYRRGINVADETLDVWAASGGAEGTDGIAVEVFDAITDLSTVVGAALYSGVYGNSPAEVAGAAYAIDSSDDNFAGVDTGDNPTWTSGEASIAVTALSKSTLRSNLFRPVKTATGRDPSFVTCSGVLFDRVKDIFEDSAQTVNEIMTRNGLVDIYKACGARAIMLDGVPFIEDRHATAATFYAWSDGDVEVRFVPAANHTDTPADLAAYVSSLTGVTISDNEIEARLKQGNGMFRPILFHIGKTGTSTKLGVRTGNFQLAWKRRNAFSKLAITGL